MSYVDSEKLRAATDRLIPHHSTRRWIRELFPNLRDAAIRWSEDDAGSMAASVAYYLALSLFPMVLLLVSGLGLFLKFTRMGQDARTHLLDVIAQQGSPVFEASFRQVIDQLENQSVISGPTGLIAAILAAIGVFSQLDRGFDRVWRTHPVKSKSLQQTVYNVMRHRFAAFMMLVSLGGMIASLFAVSMIFRQVCSVIDSKIPFFQDAIGWVDFAFTLGANALLFAMIYKFLPKCRVEWRFALRGGLLTAGIWELGRFLLGQFLIGMRYTSAYGAIGSFIAILLWCYYAMSMMFFGTEYVQVLQRRFRDSLAVQKQEPSTATPVAEQITAVAEVQHERPLQTKQRPRPAMRVS